MIDLGLNNTMNAINPATEVFRTKGPPTIRSKGREGSRVSAGVSGGHEVHAGRIDDSEDRKGMQIARVLYGRLYSSYSSIVER